MSFGDWTPDSDFLSMTSMGALLVFVFEMALKGRCEALDGGWRHMQMWRETVVRHGDQCCVVAYPERFRYVCKLQ